MPQLGVAEIFVILIVALVLFGPNRLPEVGKQAAKALRELRQMQEHLKGELDDVLGHFNLDDDEIDQPAPEHPEHPENSVDHDEGPPALPPPDEEAPPMVDPPALPTVAEPPAAEAPAAPRPPAVDTIAPAAAPSRFRAPRPTDQR